MKKIAKAVVVKILGWQVRRLRNKNDFRVIAVAGSIGKTSTKLAIANLLGRSLKVQYQEGNYNDIVSVPLIFFGLEMPSLLNPLAWLKTFMNIESQIRRVYPYENVIVELGTDGPRQLAEFDRYLKPDIGVLTAISPEHMQYFVDLDAVAKEELTIITLSKKIIYNTDLVDAKYQLSFPKSSLTYSLNSDATYTITNLRQKSDGYSFSLCYNGTNILNSEYEAYSKIQLYSLLAAVGVAHEIGLTTDQIASGIQAIKTVSGRMNRLAGVNHSIIIDDTYNASPAATKAALDTLYEQPAHQKIAILGNMNELGKYSSNAHTEIGKYCSPKELDLVVTIGPDANKYLAAAARQNGCQVKSYSNPYVAGAELQNFIKQGAVILAKGSQNGVFAEETVKLLLANPRDSIKLVRQSQQWLEKKQKSMAQLRG